MVRIMKDKEKAKWKELFYSFTQETTLHGVRYITGETHFVLRRVLWTLAVLAATGFFIWFTTDRLIYLLSNPKTVDVEVIYTDSVDFPTVTICNQNLFRISASHRLAVHDIVEDSFRHLQLGQGYQAFEVFPDTNLIGIKRPHVIYSDIGAHVCQLACTRLHGDSCCSVIYDRETRTCSITPLEINSLGVSTVRQLHTDYFRRKECEVQRTARCNFDDGVCKNFVLDFSQSSSWKLVPEGDKKLDFPHPAYDHTTMTEDGHFLMATSRIPTAKAHLLSPFILSEDNTCLSFYYHIFGGSLRVLSRTQDDLPQMLWSHESDEVLFWQRASVSLPAGYYRLVFEAAQDTASDPLNVAMDDVIIGPCTQGAVCIESPSGYEFNGVLSTTSNGQQCQPWYQLEPFLITQLFSTLHAEVIDSVLLSMNSTCRNPDNDARGPWCVIDSETTATAYCNVPKCRCRDVEYACQNGNCISPSLLCDGHDDCGDMTDEESCDTCSGWLCAFSTPRESSLPWRLNYQDQSNKPSSAVADLTEATAGDVITFLSPVISVQKPACLHVEYLLQENVQLEISTSFSNGLTDKQVLCILKPQKNPAWNSTDVPLQGSNTNFSLVFDAVVFDVNGARVNMKNLALLDENCTLVEYEDIFVNRSDIVMNSSLTSPIDEEVISNSDSETEENLELVNVHSNRSSYLLFKETIAIVRHASGVHDACVSSAECKSCMKPLAQPTACRPHFILVYNETEGISSQCKELYTGGDNMTIEECKTAALRAGGNVINFYNTSCHVVKCVDVDEPLLINTTEGSNVWILKDSHEEEGISCTFSDDCSCGYRTVSSNINNVWSKEEIVTGVANDTYNSTTHFQTTSFVRVESLGSLVPRAGDIVSLISPVTRRYRRACLVIRYFIHFMHLTVYRVTEDGAEPLLILDHNGQDSDWHTTRVDLARGEFRVRFEARYGEHVLNRSAGLDSIKLEDGRCFQGVSSPFNCSFSHEDQCDYQDASQGPHKWVRSKEKGGISPGNFYMRTSDKLVGRGTATLVSPIYQYNTSCVQFRYFMHSVSKDPLSTLSLSLVLPDKTREVVWKLRGVTDGKWHFAQAHVVPDMLELKIGSRIRDFMAKNTLQFRLVFELNGYDVRTGIDDVVVEPGDCNNEQNCSNDEYKCLPSFACIPLTSKCDGIANCEMGEDESCNPNNSTMEEELVEAQLEQEVDEPPVEIGRHTSSDVGTALNLTDIYHRLGHLGEDLIYSCAFEGRPCSHENFTQKITDYGLCYVFNSDEQPPLRTDKTGSRFGLSLTLNIEQYEYMRGPQSDAGIKMFLHAKEELPQVRDLGFAVSPGIHSLVAIRLNEADNLPPPWGDCSEKELKFYDHYVYSACIRECETDAIVEKCYCRDAYMPGFSEDNPEVCTLSKYFSCAIPHINSVNSTAKKCPCPKPCNQTIYEPGLSQAGLSHLSVDNILSENIDQLRSKYHATLESRQRVEETFVDDLAWLNHIIKQYVDLRRFTKSYLGDFERSSFANIWTSTETLVSLFKNDIENLMEDVPKYVESYEEYFSGPVEQKLVYQDDLLKILQSLVDVLGDVNVEDAMEWDTGDLLEPLLTNSELHVLLALSSHKKLHRVLSASSQHPADDFLPTHFTVTRRRCNALLTSLEEELCVLKRNISYYKEIHSNSTDNGTDASNLRDILTRYIRKSSITSACLTEYRNTLRSCQQRLEEANDLSETFVDDSDFSSHTYNYTSEILVIENDEESVTTLMNNYATAKVSRLDMLRHFDQEGISSEVHAHITGFISKIQSRLTNPLRARIKSIRRSLQNHYETAFARVSNLDKYIARNSFYFKAAELKIWKQPQPDFRHPTRYIETNREFWRIWPSDIPIGEFSEQYAADYVREGLEAFCRPLLDILDEFEGQLIVTRQKLITALDDVMQVEKEYVKLRDIDHTFILKNFLNMDVYFAQLKHQNVKQLQAYQATQFLGDIGGFMGLLLGASVLTMFELFDLLAFHFLTNLLNPMLPNDKNSDNGETKEDMTDSGLNCGSPGLTPEKDKRFIVINSVV